jgi:hypothetical protein
MACRRATRARQKDEPDHDPRRSQLTNSAGPLGCASAPPWTRASGAVWVTPVAWFDIGGGGPIKT